MAGELFHVLVLQHIREVVAAPGGPQPGGWVLGQVAAAMRPGGEGPHGGGLPVQGVPGESCFVQLPQPAADAGQADLLQRAAAFGELNQIAAVRADRLGGEAALVAEMIDERRDQLGFR